MFFLMLLVLLHVLLLLLLHLLPLLLQAPHHVNTPAAIGAAAHCNARR